MGEKWLNGRTDGEGWGGREMVEWTDGRGGVGWERNG